jgi:hypothetical protein
MDAALRLSRRVNIARFLLGLAGICVGSSAFAGIITGVTMFGPQAGVGPGLGTVAVPAIVTVLPNNDDVPAPGVLDNNIFVPIKRFDFNGYIDIEFTVAPSGGTTEYRVFESVDNNTGVDWSGYNMFLGYGVGAAFVPSGPADGLDFDAPLFTLAPVSSALPIVGLGADVLTFSGGTHGSGAESYQIRVDVPDVTTLPPGFGNFTLRQIPVPVPEPSSLVVVGLAFALAAWCRRRS